MNLLWSKCAITHATRNQISSQLKYLPFGIGVVNLSHFDDIFTAEARTKSTNAQCHLRSRAKYCLC